MEEEPECIGDPTPVDLTTFNPAQLTGRLRLYRGPDAVWRTCVYNERSNARENEWFIQPTGDRAIYTPQYCTYVDDNRGGKDNPQLANIVCQDVAPSPQQMEFGLHGNLISTGSNKPAGVQQSSGIGRYIVAVILGLAVLGLIFGFVYWLSRRN